MNYDWPASRQQRRMYGCDWKIELPILAGQRFLLLKRSIGSLETLIRFYNTWQYFMLVIVVRKRFIDSTILYTSGKKSICCVKNTAVYNGRYI